MAYIIIATMFIAAFHFMYDGIILPGIRQHLRNKLFALRDRLRMDYIKGIEKQDIEAFNMTHDAINTFANRLPLLTATVLVDVELAISKNEKLKENVDKRRAIIENCQSTEIKLINSEINKILTEAFLANTGGWLIYILPVAGVVSVWQRLVNDCRKLIAVPHHDIGKLIPYTDQCA